MANRRRGEIAARLGGRERVLCLTLGALAELEDAFRVDDLTTLGSRFASGQLSARDISRVLAAGLKGGGEIVSPDEIARLGAEETLVELAAVVADLLAVTFGTGKPDPS